MKLEKKFKQWLDTNPRYQIRDIQCEVIAEEFAIDFIDWYRKIAHILDSKYIGKISKELLEIYKKEKGL
jgi:hypothetical protein